MWNKIETLQKIMKWNYAPYSVVGYVTDGRVGCHFIDIMGVSQECDWSVRENEAVMNGISKRWEPSVQFP
jgi:hypothetical protein